MRTASSLEPLEPRVAPAGVVNVFFVGEVLHLVGDGGNNELSISGNISGSIKLTPGSGTELRFEGSTTTSPLNLPVDALKLAARFGGGNDAVSVSGTFLSLAADLGAGTDTLLMGALDVGGSIKVSGGEGNDTATFLVSPKVRVLGDLAFHMGAGNDTVNLNSTVHFIGGDCVFIGGAGADSFSVSGETTVGGNLTASFGASTGFFLFNGSILKVLGRTELNGAHESNAVFQTVFQGSSLDLLGGLAIRGGKGAESIVIQTSATVEIGMGISVHGGAGITDVFLQSPNMEIGGNAFFRSSGALGVISQSPSFTFSVAGGLMAQAGSGPVVVGINGTGTVGSNLTVGSSAGASVLLLGNIQVGQNTSFNFGAVSAPTSITVQGLTAAGKLSITTGSDNDTVVLAGLSIGGALTIKTGGGNDVLWLNHASTGGPLTFAGDLVTVNAGSGDDNVGIGYAPLGGLVAYAPVVVLGGRGADTLSFAPNGNALLDGSRTAGFETGT